MTKRKKVYCKYCAYYTLFGCTSPRIPKIDSWYEPDVIKYYDSAKLNKKNDCKMFKTISLYELIEFEEKK